jgi:hypothetical protein
LGLLRIQTSIFHHLLCDFGVARPIHFPSPLEPLQDLGSVAQEPALFFRLCGEIRRRQGDGFNPAMDYLPD